MTVVHGYEEKGSDINMKLFCNDEKRTEQAQFHV